MNRKSKALRLAECHGFTTEQEYFEYIGDSILNGQKRQAVALFLQLTDEEKRTCLDHIKEFYITTTVYEDLTRCLAVMA